MWSKVVFLPDSIIPDDVFGPCSCDGSYLLDEALSEARAMKLCHVGW